MALPVTITGISTAVAPVGPFKVPAGSSFGILKETTTAAITNSISLGADPMVTAQTFTATSSYNLFRATFQYRVTGAAVPYGPGNKRAYAELRAGSPTGAVLATSSDVVKTFASGVTDTLPFVFPSQPAIASSSVYCLVLYMTGAVPAFVGTNFYGNATNTYAGGTAYAPINGTDPTSLVAQSAAPFDLAMTIESGSITATDAYYFFGRDGTTATTLQAYKATDPTAADVNFLAGSYSASVQIGQGTSTASRCQTFTTPASAMVVIAISAVLVKTGSPTDNLKCDLYAVDVADKPTGSSLGNVTVPMSSIGTTDVVTTFTFAVPVNLSASTKYSVVLSRTGALDAANYVNWRYNTSDTYAGGGGGTFNSAGPAWTIGTNDYPMAVLAGGWSSIATKTGFTTAILSLAAYQVGNIIHLAVTDGTSTTSQATKYLSFDAFTDTFLATVETVSAAVATAIASTTNAAVVARSNGEIVILYVGLNTKTSGTFYSRLYYRRRTGVNTWSAETQVDGNVAVNCNNPTATLGAADRVHFFWNTQTGTGYRTLSAANALSTALSSASMASPGDAVSYDRSGVTKVIFISNSNGQTVGRFDSSDSPTPTFTNPTVVNADIPHRIGVDPDTKDVSIIYRNSADSDMYVIKSTDDGATFSAQVSFFVGTVASVDTNASRSASGSAYARADGRPVVGYIVNDGGTLKYNENIRYGTSDAWNIIDKSANITLTDADKTATLASGIISGVRSTTTRVNGSAGKFYSELKINSFSGSSGAYVGSQRMDTAVTTTTLGPRVQLSTGNIAYEGSFTALTLGAVVANDIISFAWDSSAKTVWFRKNNGLWNNDAAANPATGTNGISSTGGVLAYALWFTSQAGTDSVTLRTEVADLSYYGPVGFTSWMGEALPIPSIADAWNANDKNGGTLSNSDKTITNGQVRSTKIIAANDGGKYYCEAVWGNTAVVDGGSRIGIHDSSTPINQNLFPISVHSAISLGANGIYLGNGTITTSVNLSVNCIGSFAFDTVNLRGWVRKNNGLWNNNASADPATNVGGMDLSSWAGKTFAIGGAAQYSVGESATVRTRKADLTQFIPDGFTSWMGETVTVLDGWSLTDKTSDITLSNSNWTATHTGTSTGGHRSNTTRVSGTAGKYYAEFLLGNVLPAAIGIQDLPSTIADNSKTIYVAMSGQIYGPPSATLIGGLGSSLAAGDMVSVAWDAGAKTVWFRKNFGLWNNSGTADPVTGVGGLDVSAAANVAHALWSYTATNNSSVSIRAYGVPSGYTSWMVVPPTNTPDAWNIADKSSNVTLSNSDKTADITTAVLAGMRSSTSHLNGSAGQWYVEFKLDTQNGLNVGVKGLATTVTDNTTESIYYSSGAGFCFQNAAAKGAASSSSPIAGDIICMAWDTSAEKMWFRKNNENWNNSGTANPATGTGGFDVSLASSVDYCLWYATSSINTVTVRTRTADLTQKATAPAGFLSWMGETVVLAAVTGTGALTAQTTTVSGLGASISTSTAAALTTAVSTVVCPGIAQWRATGTLPATTATLAATGTVVATGTGVLTTGIAALVSNGRGSSTGTAVLTAASVTVIGVGTVASPAITGTGVLNAVAFVGTGATNYALQSETLDIASWNPQSVTVTANAATAPNSTTTAERVTDNTASAQHYIYQDPILADDGHIFTYSIYAKAETLSWLQLAILFDNSAYVNFNLATGVIGNSSGVLSSNIVAVGNGWYRCSLTRTTVGGANDIFIELSNGNPSGIASYAGTGTGSLLIWGVQVELGSTPTTYIPTTTAPVTGPAGGTLVGSGTVVTPAATGTGALTTGVVAVVSNGISGSTGAGAGAANDLVINDPANSALQVFGGTGGGYFENVGQTFIAGGPSISRVRIALVKSAAGSPAGTIQVKLHTVNAGHLPLTAIGASSVVTSSSLSTLLSLVEFTFSPPVSVTPGTEYVFTTTRSVLEDYPNDINLNLVFSNPYTSGQILHTASGVWEEVGPYDLDCVISFIALGGLISSSATLVGSVTLVPVTGTGTLSAQSSIISSVGISESRSTSTVLNSQNSTLAGVAVSTSRNTAAALVAPNVTMTGLGTSQSVQTLATVTAQSSTLSSVGVSQSRSTSTVLNSQNSTFAGLAISGATGTGVLVGQTSALAGNGIDASIGTGALVAQSSALVVTGVGVSTGTGGLNAGIATLSGSVGTLRAIISWVRLTATKVPITVTSGPLAVVEAADTPSFVGTVQNFIYSGPLVAVEAADTPSFVGTVVNQGTLAVVEATDTASFVGTVIGAGTGVLAATNSTVVSSGTSSSTGTGVLTSTNSILASSGVSSSTSTTGAVNSTTSTVVGSGVVAWRGTGVLTSTNCVSVGLGVSVSTGTGVLNSATSSIVGSGKVTWAGTGVIISTSSTIVSSGIATSFGTLAVIEAPDIAIFVASGISSGLLTVVEGPDAPVFNGITSSTGTGALTSTSTVVGSGKSISTSTTGVLNSTISTLAGSGTAFHKATLVATEAPDTALFNGTVVNQGTLSVIEATDTPAFNGTVFHKATLVAIEASDTPVFNGTVASIGTLAVIEAPDTAIFVASSTSSGSLIVSEAPDTAAFNGSVFHKAILTAVEANDNAVLVGTVVNNGTLVTIEAPDTAVFAGLAIRRVSSAAALFIAA